jgi:GT2 family glycosyltransferase
MVAAVGSEGLSNRAIEIPQTDPPALAHGASVIVVAYGVDTLDLSWVPPDAPVLVVHNDMLLTESACRPGCDHFYPGSNIGFGRGVNLALRDVATRRVIICNPDTVLSAVHWDALVEAQQNDVVTIPLIDENGFLKASAFPYPSPTLLLLGTARAIRAAPVGTVRRKILSRLLGDWGRDRKWTIAQPPGRYSLVKWWASGAVLSFDTQLLKSVNGFDPAYFLYFEDTDLSKRIAKSRCHACLVIADTPPALHRVGGSAVTLQDKRRVTLERWQSARRYASTESGLRWRVAAALLFVGATGHRMGSVRSVTRE